MKTKITQEIINGTVWGGQNVIVRDAELHGFFLCVSKRAKTFKAQADIKVGGVRRTKRQTIGDAELLNVQIARKLAQKWFSEVRDATEPNRVHSSISLYDLLEEILIRRGLKAGKRHLHEKLRNLRRWLPDRANEPARKLNDACLMCAYGEVKAKFGVTTAESAMRLLRFIKDNDVRNEMAGLSRQLIDKSLQHSKPGYSNDRSIPLENLSEWYRRVQILPNPLRRNMHLVGLYTGLRPAVYTRLQKDDIDFENQVAHVRACITPNNHSFDCFLSHESVAILEEVLELHAAFGISSKLLFPAKSSSDRDIPSITREKSMPGLTGSVLRNTHRVVAQNMGMARDLSMILAGGRRRPDQDMLQEWDFQNLSRGQKQALSRRITDLLKSSSGGA